MSTKTSIVAAAGLCGLMFLAQNAYCAMKAIEAETCPGVEKAAIVDAGGGAGKAVLMRPGGRGLTADIELGEGIYSISMIARNPEGKPGVDLMTLEVKEQKTGKVRAWTMPVAYSGQYRAVGRMYFPAYAGGKYTVTASLALKVADVTFEKGVLDATGSQEYEEFAFDKNTKSLVKPLLPLLVDRMELQDALENCAKKAFKTKRTLTSDAELGKIRKDFADGKTKIYSPNYDKVRISGAATEPRQARNDELWNRAPDFNELTGFDDYTKDAHGWLLGGHVGSGMVAESADWYEKTGNADIGWDAAVSLCALAEKYPAFDPLVQLVMGNRYTLVGNRFGDVAALATAYDRLFDFVKDNEELAAYAGSKIPWIKNSKDVVRFLDVNILQTAFDSLLQNRRYTADPKGAVIAAVQGVCEEGDRMLESGAFRAFEGVLPHKFFFRGPVDDVSYISPFRCDIWDVAPYLALYHRLGGSFRYDLETLHPGYSTQWEIAQWEQLHLSGGFRTAMAAMERETRVEFMPGWPDRGPAKVSGHMGMFVIITNSSPSRVMENIHGTHIAMDSYSMSILESGQFQDDLLKMRGSWVQYNQMGLPLQATAHGGLSLTHFNRQSHQELGRPAFPGRGDPTDRALNVVEVDSLRNMPRINPSGVNFLAEEGKAFPAGMNTSFAPMSGAQFMEHAQTAFKDVSLYVRQTAMIDVGDAESYLFDVVRVRGGKLHAYCLNAFPGKFESNMKMSPVATENRSDLNACLDGYYDATQSEGVNPEVIQADWVMDPYLQQYYQDQSMAMTTPADQQKHLQDSHYTCNRYDSSLPVTTRLSLLGHAKDLAMVGRWSTVNPTLDYWNLYVEGKQEKDGKESVYPGIIETFAGKPFLGGKRLLRLSPETKGAEASVGVEVKTLDGRTDVLYSSFKPREIATVDGTVKMSGRFAMLSRDGEGLRQVAIVGGGELSAADILLKPDRIGYDAKIVGIDYDRYTFSVADALPTGALKNEYVNMEAGGRLYKFKLVGLKAEGGKTVVSYERTPKIFQSNLADVNEQEDVVSTAIGPFTVRVGMTLTNEKQDKFWRVKEVTEKPSRCKVDGKVKKTDFTDANGDGKIKVSACLFGPGDRMTTDTHVNVLRLAPGEYRVESNVGCTVGLPKGEFSKAEISADGVAFSPIASKVDGARLVLKFEDKDFENGRIVMRLQK